jgi:hypothetical protein
MASTQHLLRTKPFPKSIFYLFYLSGAATLSQEFLNPVSGKPRGSQERVQNYVSMFIFPRERVYDFH